MTSVLSDVDWQSKKHTILERNRFMFNNPNMSDISFTCKGSDKVLYAHKFVLSTGSTVFKAMFYGKLAEKSSVLHLDDADEESLEEFLRFVYTDDCTLTTDNVVSVLYLSKKYIVPSLTDVCASFLENGLEIENVLTILEHAMYFDVKDLESKCWKVVDWHISEIVTLESFKNTSLETLACLLKRESLIISEICLFKAVLKWIHHQCSEQGLELTTENRRTVIGDAVYDIRFLATDKKQFLQHVIDSGLLTYEEIEAIQGKFKGVDTLTLKWQLGVRKQNYDMLVFKRFDHWRADGLYYNGEQDCLCFSVDREVLFHGVRLYGDLLESLYVVTLEVEGVKVEGTYQSKKVSDGNYGYYVMTKLPVLIKQNKVVKMSASIKGPPSSFGIYRIAPVTVDGVTVTFHDADTPRNRTSTTFGQFRDILLSV